MDWGRNTVVILFTIEHLRSSRLPSLFDQAGAAAGEECSRLPVISAITGSNMLKPAIAAGFRGTGYLPVLALRPAAFFFS